MKKQSDIDVLNAYRDVEEYVQPTEYTTDIPPTPFYYPELTNHTCDGDES